MSETTEWTTVAIPQDEMPKLRELKPEHMSWYEWIEALATDGEAITHGPVHVDEQAIHEAVKAGMVAAGEDENVKTANVIAEGLMQRSREVKDALDDMDEVVRESAYEGAREAMEE